MNNKTLTSDIKRSANTIEKPINANDKLVKIIEKLQEDKSDLSKKNLN